jgi:DNA-binding response OmpR family regulator
MTKKILIVDDEKDTVSFLKKGLEREGFQVICAFGGREAKAKILDQKPDLILLDLVMPDLSGWEVLKWLKEEERLPIPTIIVSAKGELGDMKKGYSLEADTYLIKPVSIADILKSIQIVSSLEVE